MPPASMNPTAIRPSPPIGPRRAVIVTGAREFSVPTRLVSGTFDGSSLELRHHRTIAGDKIMALAIKA